MLNVGLLPHIYSLNIIKYTRVIKFIICMVDSYLVQDAHKYYVFSFIGENTPLLKLAIYEFSLIYFVLRFVYIIILRTDGALVSPFLVIMFLFFSDSAESLVSLCVAGCLK